MTKLQAIIGTFAGLGALLCLGYTDIRSEPAAEKVACPQQICKWRTWTDFEGNQVSSWICETPGFATKQACSWELGDCYHKPCNKRSPGYTFGTPERVLGG